MTITRQEFLALYLELTNEAAVVAQTVNDPVLYDLASEAAIAAGQQLGLRDDQVLAMQRDMFENRMGGPVCARLVPDLEGPATAKAVAEERKARDLAAARGLPSGD